LQNGDTVNGAGPIHSAGPSTSLKVKIRSLKPPGVKSKGKGRAFDNGIVPDPFCSFCGGTKEQNKLGHPEKMVSCHLCGRSGHFTCLAMTNAALQRAVQEYDWECIECKTCQVCALKEREVSGTLLPRLTG
jgi:hypothetical protein